MEQWKREKGYKHLRKQSILGIPHVIKTHVGLEHFLGDGTNGEYGEEVEDITVFSAAMTKQEGMEMTSTLTKEGHVVAFIQDMETLKEIGISGLVRYYVHGFNLNPNEDGTDMEEYFNLWAILRQCCGQQMSSKWRNDMMPPKYKRKDLSSHPTCGNYDIDTIEQSFLKTKLYNLLEQYENVRILNRPSMNDDMLNGTYCSSYNYMVRMRGLNIWGTEGGRPVRTALDHAIRYYFQLGRPIMSTTTMMVTLDDSNESVGRNNNDYSKSNIMDSLFNYTSFRVIWKLDEETKRSWLKSVLDLRGEPKEEEERKLWAEHVALANGEDVGNKRRADNPRGG